MNKVLIVGSINMDMVTAVNSIPKKGETVLASTMQKYHGGKGANQGVASSRFGAKTSFIGAIGDDEDGKTILESMKSEGIYINGIKIHENEKTGMAWITVDQKGENSIVVISGANGAVSKEDIDDNEALFREADIVLLQLEIPVETVAYAINKGKENGCRIILNPAPAVKLDMDILSKVDIITPNESELDILTSGIDAHNRIEKAQSLIKQGVDNVICTLGAKGVLYVKKDGFSQFPAYSVDAIDTTGAGDCFNGVLAAELSNNESIETAIKIAIKASSLSVTKKGAQSSMPRKQDVENIKN
ncbi:MAG: rbsK [Clostridia bacterium]|jgi:ribokinase|nr:rbsK [Clostridia bacterium]